MTKKGVIPEWFYCPYSSPRQSLSRGPEVFKNQKKKQKRGCPIKDFGNDGRGGFLNVSIAPCLSFLNGSTRNLNQRRGNPPFSVIARSDWESDLAFWVSKYLKSKLDRVKNLGLPRHTELRGSQWPPSTIIPEWFYHLFSSPRQSLSRGPWFLKVFGFPIKDFRNDEGGRSSFLNGSITLIRHPWVVLSGVHSI